MAFYLSKGKQTRMACMIGFIPVSPSRCPWHMEYRTWLMPSGWFTVCRGTITHQKGWPLYSSRWDAIIIIECMYVRCVCSGAQLCYRNLWRSEDIIDGSGSLYLYTVPWIELSQASCLEAQGPWLAESARQPIMVSSGSHTQGPVKQFIVLSIWATGGSWEVWGLSEIWIFKFPHRGRVGWKWE